ncbi:MAG: AlbA family DNA-binding domain-containing protein [Opitutaceae bacterium]
MKTVAAFANSQGGTLLIGVDDAGNILGLEHDYLSLQDGNRDKFELHLRNLLTDRAGRRTCRRKRHDEQALKRFVERGRGHAAHEDVAADHESIDDIKDERVERGDIAAKAATRVALAQDGELPRFFSVERGRGCAFFQLPKPGVAFDGGAILGRPVRFRFQHQRRGYLIGDEVAVADRHHHRRENLERGIERRELSCGIDPRSIGDRFAGFAVHDAHRRRVLEIPVNALERGDDFRRGRRAAGKRMAGGDFLLRQPWPNAAGGFFLRTSRNADRLGTGAGGVG